MSKQYFLGAALFLIGVLSLVVCYQSQGLKRCYRAAVLQGLKQNPPTDSSVINDNDLRHLPQPLQKYLRYAEVLGKAKVQNIRFVFEGEMKLDPKQDWVNIRAEQYDFLAQPTRLFYIQVNVRGLPVMGLDSFVEGRGGMLIKLAGLVTVANDKGTEMNQAELVTLFNDICLWAPGALISPCFRWEMVDPLTVKGAFTHDGKTVSARLSFNEQGQLTNFVTDDRYYATGKKYLPVRWSTPVKPSDYQEYNGVRVPAYAEAIWHLSTGDLCYAKYRLKELAYNCDQFENSK